ncbi:MAG TPA: hypothetical protein V6C81_07960 [Planktothrix sp.]|jgi:hypothetical protein
MRLSDAVVTVASNLNPVDFCTGAFAAGLEKPYNAVAQLSGHKLHEMHLVDEGRSTVASEVGNLAGTAVDMAVLGLATGKVLSPLLERSTVSLASGVKLGTSGAIYGGIFTSSDKNKGLLRGRLENAAVGGVTFAAMGAAGGALEKSALFGPTSLKSRVFEGALSGAVGGVANSFAADGIQHRSLPGVRQVASTTLKYAAFGGMFGGATRAFETIGKTTPTAPNNAFEKPGSYQPSSASETTGRTDQTAASREFEVLGDTHQNAPSAAMTTTSEQVRDDPAVADNSWGMLPKTPDPALRGSTEASRAASTLGAEVEESNAKLGTLPKTPEPALNSSTEASRAASTPGAEVDESNAKLATLPKNPAVKNGSTEARKEGSTSDATDVGPEAIHNARLDALAQHFADTAAAHIENLYGLVDPRIGIHLTDPNVILTLAAVSPRAEFEFNGSILKDGDAIATFRAALFKRSGNSLIWMQGDKGGVLMYVSSASGLQRATSLTSLPGVAKYDAASGERGSFEWTRKTVDGLTKAKQDGLYPPNTHIDTLLYGVMKGYPDDAILAAATNNSRAQWSDVSSRYSDYNSFAQSKNQLEANSGAANSPRVDFWDKVLEKFYGSSVHKELASNPVFQTRRETEWDQVFDDGVVDRASHNAALLSMARDSVSRSEGAERGATRLAESDSLARQLADTAAGNIQNLYGLVDPRIGIHLTDPNVVLTLAGVRGQTEFYLSGVKESDTDQLTRLNEESQKRGIHLEWRNFPEQDGMVVGMRNLAGYERTISQTSLPGVAKYDIASGWDGLNAWYKQTFDGLEKAKQEGLYLPQTDIGHMVIGVAKGYPDPAVESIASGVPHELWVDSRVPYAGYYNCAQPNFDYEIEDAAAVRPLVALWGTVLKNYYDSDYHSTLESDPAFNHARQSDGLG